MVWDIIFIFILCFYVSCEFTSAFGLVWLVRERCVCSVCAYSRCCPLKFWGALQSFFCRAL